MSGKITEWHAHDNYTRPAFTNRDGAMKNDVAVAKIQCPTELSKQVTPVLLPKSSDSIRLNVSLSVWVTGFGPTNG